MTDRAIVPCETCGTEGRRLTASSMDPNEAVDWGPCPDCGGTGEWQATTHAVSQEEVDRMRPSVWLDEIIREREANDLQMLRFLGSL